MFQLSWLFSSQYFLSEKARPQDGTHAPLRIDEMRQDINNMNIHMKIDCPMCKGLFTNYDNQTKLDLDHPCPLIFFWFIVFV